MATDMNRAYMGGLDCRNVHFRTRPHSGDDNDRTELAQTFHLKSGACRVVQENQPFYKKRIPAVNNHFAKMYNLK